MFAFVHDECVRVAILDEGDEREDIRAVKQAHQTLK